MRNLRGMRNLRVAKKQRRICQCNNAAENFNSCNFLVLNSFLYSAIANLHN